MEINKRQSLIRLWGIIGNPDADPPIEPKIPVCRATIYNWIAAGKFPKPVKIEGGRAAFWRTSEVDAAIQQMGGE